MILTIIFYVFKLHFMTYRRSRIRKPLYPGTWGSGRIPYIACFQAYSMSSINRPKLEIGDKIILPPQALKSINRLRLPFPLIFEIRNQKKNIKPHITDDEIQEQYKRRLRNIYRTINPKKLPMIDKWMNKKCYKSNPHSLYLKVCSRYNIQPKAKITNNNSRVHKFYKSQYFQQNQNENKNVSQTISQEIQNASRIQLKQYCSVFEFSSTKDFCAYLPKWMMENLKIRNGDKIEIESQFNVKKGTFCKLRLDEKFIRKLSNTGFKGTLEYALRHYSALSLNQRLIIEYNDEKFDIFVVECEPSNVISILGTTDLKVTFEVPNGETANVVNHGDIIDDISDSLQSINLNENENYKLIVDKTKIDGKLLKSLGIPLGFLEQNILAQTIIENRIMFQENRERLYVMDEHSDIDGNSDDNRTEEELSLTNNFSSIDDIQPLNVDEDSSFFGINIDSPNVEEEMRDIEEKLDVISDEKLTPIGPNSIQCKNCDKFINQMSFQMHSIHCLRNIFRCNFCQQCIHKNEEEKHMQENHTSFECELCSEIFSGENAMVFHQENTCLLRNVKCIYCANDVSAIDIKEHQHSCGKQQIKCNKCHKKFQLKLKDYHDCGNFCILCGMQIEFNRDLLLHMITDCAERRANCNFCDTFRVCRNMSEHQQFCGSRSEKCEVCGFYIQLRFMEKHLFSECMKYTNKQFGKKTNNSSCNTNNVAVEMSEEMINNPYLDKNLLTSMNADFGNTNDIEICPYCKIDIIFDNYNDFVLHIVKEHSECIHSELTQKLFKKMKKISMERNKREDEVFSKSAKMEVDGKLGEKLSSQNKRKRSLKNISSGDGLVVNGKSVDGCWTCTKCTFENKKIKRFCQICNAKK